MRVFICKTCGTEYPPSDAPPPSCPICLDERQYLPLGGQQWTDSETLVQSHRLIAKEQEPDLIGIGMEPNFAIGQRALFIRTPLGNVLWDCVTLIDGAMRDRIMAWGGLKAIAISHPHYYSGMISWSRAFGDVPVLIHEADRQWAMRSDGNIEFWEGDARSILPGVTLIRCGGHFAGGTVLHWAAGAEGKGALLSGDILQVAADNHHVGFMRSYPNYMPLSPAVVTRIVDRLRPYAFDRVYGAFWDRVITTDGKASVTRSAKRYIDAVSGHGPADAET
jgi:glyoxylase-like metal-dependent hydrolase (beta-lactamase superfamily II)